MSNLINEVCSTSGTTKNMGGKDQCLEAPVKTFFLAKDGFAFASLAAMKLEANWNTAIAAKNIIPLPNIEGLELANTEASIKEGRYKDYELKEAVAGVKYRLDLSMCSYEALKSYKNSEYKRVFEVTNEDEVTGDVQADDTIKGRKISSFIIGVRNQATDEDVPYVDVSLKFEKDTYSVIKPSFELSDKEGIFDVGFALVSATSTEIKVTATTDCSNSLVNNFTSGDLTVLDAAGAAQSLTSTSVADASGVYTIVGTGFATGFTVGLNGVVVQAGINYESPDRLAITV
tara:strand:+ start:1358 stop:2221 length:864 start_codon:yes stop_codon:yes gene_type:complete